MAQIQVTPGHAFLLSQEPCSHTRNVLLVLPRRFQEQAEATNPFWAQPSEGEPPRSPWPAFSTPVQFSITLPSTKAAATPPVLISTRRTQ